MSCDEQFMVYAHIWLAASVISPTSFQGLVTAATGFFFAIWAIVIVRKEIKEINERKKWYEDQLKQMDRELEKTRIQEDCKSI